MIHKYITEDLEGLFILDPSTKTRETHLQSIQSLWKSRLLQQNGSDNLGTYSCHIGPKCLVCSGDKFTHVWDECFMKPFKGLIVDPHSTKGYMVTISERCCPLQLRKIKKSYLLFFLLVINGIFLLGICGWQTMQCCRLIMG